MKKIYNVKRECSIPDSFFISMAANSVDLNIKEKSIHEFSIEADVESPFSVGLIIGTSGAGKTSLAKSIWGEDCLKTHLNLSTSLIDQFPSDFKYEDRVDFLNGIGLSSVTNWVRPAYTLSNGEKQRAECALAVANSRDEITVIDEYSSLVDRTVAKVMSHAISKFIKKRNKRIVLVSCHSDVADFLDPDWIIDVNKLEFIDRRRLSSEERVRKEKLIFTVRKCARSEWNGFKSRHYLSSALPGGKVFYFGLYNSNSDIVAFCAWCNYVPKRVGAKLILHGARCVVAAEYCGLNLGIQLINETAAYLKKTISCEIRASFSNVSIHKAMMKDKRWTFLDKKLLIKHPLTKRMRLNDIDSKIFSRLKDRSTFRSGVTQFRHKFIG